MSDLTSQNQTNKKPATSMAQLMASAGRSIKTLQKGDEVWGTVKKLTPQEILLDIGFKSDALVLEFDKQNVANLMRILKVGDRVKASVLSPESEAGFPVLSLRRTLDDVIFLKLEDYYNKQEVMDVLVTEVTRGGFFVETDNGIRGFLPNSQVLDDHNLAGKKIKVKIIEFDKAKKRIIFSEKANMFMIDASEIEKHLKKDDVVEATVNSSTNHGLYTTIDLKEVNMPIEGYIHISEVSYQRIDNLQNMFKKGDKLKTQVVEIDKENRRVNLSLKRLEKDKFEDIKQNYKKDQKITAVVSSLKGKGITLEIAKNVLGFIPESKVPAGKTYETGEKVDALVEDFDDKKKMIILSPILKEKPIIYR